MIQFKGFKPEAEERLARMMGYSGDMNGFATYLAQNPDKQDLMNNYKKQAIGMLKGGVVPKENNMSRGGYRTGSGEYTELGQSMAERAYNPYLPYGGAVTAQGISQRSNQFIGNKSGQVSGRITSGTSQAKSYTAGVPKGGYNSSYVMRPDMVTDDIRRFTRGIDDEGVQGKLSADSYITAAQRNETLVSGLEAEQGEAILMDNPVQRELQEGELVKPVANAQTAAKFTEQIQAATALPSKKATVQGQLEGLMEDFEGGETPAWAAGAMRAAMGTLSSRGLGASSIAGQAVVQAAMESALPIAQADAGTRAAFEAQNLSNIQERAMLGAQQRAAFIGMEFDQAFQARVMNASKVSDIANMNFTAEQQIALENSRMANSMNLQNLNNSQALVMAEAAALSQLDMANLSNEQQAAVQNAQNFLAMDMKNLDLQQQTSMFKNQAIQQGLFTDAAARNAARQFNATSKMQVDQYFTSMKSQTSQFNASQRNAQAQFNAGEKNVINRFNAELINQRQQFNAKNRLLIDQNNVQWRREVATANTAAVNRANELNASAVLDMSETAYNNLWQYYSDSMEFAWQSAENERSRINQLALTKLQADANADIAALKNDYASSVGFGNLIGTMLTSDLSGSFLGNIFPGLG